MWRGPLDPAEEFIQRRLRRLREGKAGKLGPGNSKPPGIIFGDTSIQWAAALVVGVAVGLLLFMIFHGL